MEHIYFECSLSDYVFTEGQILRRRDIHDMYGGNRQSGICPSAKMPYIFIFSGAGGHAHGYKDEWLNEDVYSYTGEGQRGDMQFTKGNLALRDHLSLDKRVFLFEYVTKGHVQFVSELNFLDYGYFPAKDTNGDDRIGIKFFFKRIGETNYTIPKELNTEIKVSDSEPLYKIDVPNTTERRGLVNSRVGQGAYRKSILHRWRYKCAATGYDDLNVLIASHILPWKESDDYQRLDVDNGLLLSPDFDALFDKNLISFDHSTGAIIKSDKLRNSKVELLGVSGREKIITLTEGNKEYLKTHNSLLL